MIANAVFCAKVGESFFTLKERSKMSNHGCFSLEYEKKILPDIGKPVLGYGPKLEERYRFPGNWAIVKRQLDKSYKAGWTWRLVHGIGVLNASDIILWISLPKSME